MLWVKCRGSSAAEFGFEEAAIEAISQWLYAPARLHGKPVDVYFTVIAEFALQ